MGFESFGGEGVCTLGCLSRVAPIHQSTYLNMLDPSVATIIVYAQPHLRIEQIATKLCDTGAADAFKTYTVRITLLLLEEHTDKMDLDSVTSSSPPSFPKFSNTIAELFSRIDHNCKFELMYAKFSTVFLHWRCGRLGIQTTKRRKKKKKRN